jgi:hypothetical protein
VRPVRNATLPLPSITAVSDRFRCADRRACRPGFGWRGSLRDKRGKPSLHPCAFTSTSRSSPT